MGHQTVTLDLSYCLSVSANTIPYAVPPRAPTVNVCDFITIIYRLSSSWYEVYESSRIFRIIVVLVNTSCLLMLHEEVAFGHCEDVIWFLLLLRLIVPKLVSQLLRFSVLSLQVLCEQYNRSPA